MAVLANRPQPAPWPAPEPSLRVLQVCPRDQAPPGDARPGEPKAAHTAAGVAFGLCRALDAAGVHQQIVTAGPPRSPGRRRWGLHGEIHRVVPPAGARQLFGLAAAPLVVELAKRADLIHVHPEGDPSALAVALWAARRHELATLVGPVPGRPGGSNGSAGTTGRLPRAAEVRLLRRADAVLCPDGETLRRLAQRGLPEEVLTPLPWIGPRTGNDAGNDPVTEPGEVAPAIRWGPAAGDLLEVYRRVRRRTGAPGRGEIAGRPLAEATGEGP